MWESGWQHHHLNFVFFWSLVREKKQNSWNQFGSYRNSIFNANYFLYILNLISILSIHLLLSPVSIRGYERRAKWNKLIFLIWCECKSLGLPDLHSVFFLYTTDTFCLDLSISLIKHKTDYFHTNERVCC